MHLNFLSTGYLKPGAHVKPGETFTYKWRVPENGGPTESDPPCLTYLYYSATDAVKDTNSGLVGPLLVCRKNALNHDGTQVPNVNICLSLTAGWCTGGSQMGNLPSSQAQFTEIKRMSLLRVKAELKGWLRRQNHNFLISCLFPSFSVFSMQ